MSTVPQTELVSRRALYWADYAPDDVLGMILTQSDGTWTAQSAPLPSDESNSAQAVNANVQMAKSDAVTE